MDLNKLVLQNSDFRISNDTIFHKKLIWIPLAKIINKKLVYIFLDPKSSKVIIKFIKYLQKNTNYKFYFISPLLSDPHNVRTKLETNELNIENYLKNYVRPEFYDEFERIGFDFIQNLVDFSNKTKSYNLINKILEKMNKDIQDSYYDHYSKKYVFFYSKEVRERFSSLFREIQLKNLLK